jgi:hypothetical protein
METPNSGYDYWRDDSGAYLVMRLLSGGSLKGGWKQPDLLFRLLQEIKDSVKRATTSSQFQQYAGIPDHYSLELALTTSYKIPNTHSIL